MNMSRRGARGMRSAGWCITGSYHVVTVARVRMVAKGRLGSNASAGK